MDGLKISKPKCNVTQVRGVFEMAQKVVEGDNGHHPFRIYKMYSIIYLNFFVPSFCFLPYNAKSEILLTLTC